jgi:putative flippase GtrA
VLNTHTFFRLVRTAVVGGAATVVDFGTAWWLRHLVQPLIAVSISYFVAVTCHFLLNKFWVFRCRRNDYARQLVQYGTAVLASWLMTVSTVQLCLSTFTNNILFAKLFAIPPATLVGFVLMQLIVFRKPGKSLEEFAHK